MRTAIEMATARIVSGIGAGISGTTPGAEGLGAASRTGGDASARIAAPFEQVFEDAVGMAESAGVRERSVDDARASEKAIARGKKADPREGRRGGREPASGIESESEAGTTRTEVDEDHPADRAPLPEKTESVRVDDGDGAPEDAQADADPELCRETGPGAEAVEGTEGGEVPSPQDGQPPIGSPVEDGQNDEGFLLEGDPLLPGELGAAPISAGGVLIPLPYDPVAEPNGAAGDAADGTGSYLFDPFDGAAFDGGETPSDLPGEYGQGSGDPGADGRSDLLDLEAAAVDSIDSIDPVDPDVATQAEAAPLPEDGSGEQASPDARVDPAGWKRAGIRAGKAKDGGDPSLDTLGPLTTASMRLWEQVLAARIEEAAPAAPAAAAESGSPSAPAAVAAGAAGDAQETPAEVKSEFLDLRESRERWANRLAAAIRSQARGGNSQLRMVLKPPQLGQVELKLSLRGPVLRVEIEVESNAARHILTEGAGDLRASLRNSGLELEKLHIAVSEREGRRDGSGEHRKDGGGRRDSSEGSGASGDAPADESEAPGAAGGWTASLSIEA